ncbi:MAG TPA: ABC transporter permease [Spirochaetia bacterium]|nr:ABC transporter permease [Spirochaetales bacterium]HRY79781.1 ABC transporter permease [Spirochaetia bacterium]HRZ90375.1 ABC transporter permease [Spirochaetia bacterium]
MNDASGNPAAAQADSRRLRAPGWVFPALLLAVLILSVLRFDLIESLLGIRARGLLVSRIPLWELALQHLGLVAASSAAAVPIALGLGIAAVRFSESGLRALLVAAGSAAQTFPSAAVLALSVPLAGFGFAPTFLALSLYGMLPVLHNTIAGLEGVPEAAVDAARGMGMRPRQVLIRVQLPLALPVILAGVRTSVVINTAAATLGAAMGAGGLGLPIISGIRSFDPALILRGAVPSALLALFADASLRRLEDRARRAAGGKPDGRGA